MDPTAGLSSHAHGEVAAVPAPEPITIARVIARLNVGGPATQAILMTEEFSRRGHNPLLLAGVVPPEEDSMEYRAEERGVPVLRISKMSRRIAPLRDLQALCQIVNILRKEHPVIVHTHTAKAGTLGRLAALLTGVPVRVHTFHGHVFSGYFSPAMNWVFLTIERFLARHTDRIIAISESQKHELAAIYRIAPPEKIAVVPLGLDLGRFLHFSGLPGALRDLIACPPQAPLVGWVGRLTPIKQPAMVLEVAARLQQRCPELRFVMVGDGELRASLQHQAEQRHLHSSVSFVGFQKDMPAAYRDLDFLLLTSSNEGTPLALLEAMASGKSFVATDVGGVRDLMVGEPRAIAGFDLYQNGIVAPRDPEVLASAVLYLLANPELCSAMGQAGKEFVRHRYTYQRLADDLEAIYREIGLAKAVLSQEACLTLVAAGRKE